LRRALLMLEAAKGKANSMEIPLSSLSLGDIPLADWEVGVGEIGKLMLEEQSTNNLLRIRTKLYELLSHCIPASVVMKELVRFLVGKVDQELKVCLFADAALYEHNLSQG